MRHTFFDAPHFLHLVAVWAKGDNVFKLGDKAAGADDEIAGAPPSLTARPDDDGLIARIDGDTSCVVVQYPDILGRLPDLAKIAEAAHDQGALLIAVNTEPVALGAIASPGELGADIVITGRVADASLITGCMLHAAGWAGIAEAEGAAVAGPVHAWAPESVDSPLDVLAAWTVAGHLIECGAQVTGGNATDWATIEDLANVGYPVAEVGFDGSVVISKPENTGGVVNRRVVAEQLLYEIGDPSAYITPDAIIDITEVTLTEIGKDRVEMKGARGLAPTPWLKVSACRIDGWFAASELIVPGQDCLSRAQRMDEVLRGRLEHLTELHIHTEYLGAGALSPPALRPPVELFEVVVRWAASSPRRGDIETFGMAIAPLVLTSPAGVSGMGARARPRQQLRFIPLLVKRGLIEQAVRVRTFQSRAGRLADRHNWIEDSMFSRLQRMSERRNEHRLRGRLAEGLLRRLVEPAEEEANAWRPDRPCSAMSAAPWMS